MKGIYKYNHRRVISAFPYYEYVGFMLRVEVLAELPKTYKVKYLGFHANGAPPGTITNVRKRSVTLEGVAIKPAPEPRQYDPELIRKPYKDD